MVEGVQSPRGHGQGPLPSLCGAPPFAKAALEQLNALGVNAAATPPASVAAALGLGLGRGSSGSVGASSADAASSWTWPSMGATPPTAGGVCVSPVSLPSLRAWARACRRE